MIPFCKIPKTRTPSILILCLAILCVACPCFAETVRDTRMALGTHVTVMIWESKEEKAAAKAIDQAFAEIERVESIFSTYREQSEISKINNAAGISPVKVSAETLTMLKQGRGFAQISKGAFDITFAGAGKLYVFGSEKGKVPSQEQIDKALQKVGIERLKLDPETQTAYLERPETKIDLGGYIKGYAVDSACAVIKKAGFTDFIVNAGGDMYVAGSKGKQSWRIGIQSPRGNRDELVAALSVNDRAVVTSGDYERFFLHEGKRYHHILDARTGRPARRCQSVTVIAAGVMEADAMATIVFILGPEAGIGLVESMQNTQCLVIDAKGKWHYSSGFKKVCNFSKIDE